MTKQQIENGAKALYSEYQQRMSKFASSKWEDLYESGKYGWRATFLAALAFIREQGPNAVHREIGHCNCCEEWRVFLSPPEVKP
jgi:hypothetical protein